MENNERFIINMMIESGYIDTLDLLGTNKHKRENGIYKYAFIVSKYITALKPINDLTAKEITDMIAPNMCDKFDVFVMGIKKHYTSIKDEDVIYAFASARPTLTPEIKEFYDSLMGL